MYHTSIIYTAYRWKHFFLSQVRLSGDPKRICNKRKQVQVFWIRSHTICLKFSNDSTTRKEINQKRRQPSSTRSLSSAYHLYINMASESNLFRLLNFKKETDYIQWECRVKPYLCKYNYALVAITTCPEEFEHDVLQAWKQERAKVTRSLPSHLVTPWWKRQERSSTMIQNQPRIYEKNLAACIRVQIIRLLPALLIISTRSSLTTRRNTVISSFQLDFNDISDAMNPEIEAKKNVYSPSTTGQHF